MADSVPSNSATSDAGRDTGVKAPAPRPIRWRFGDWHATPTHHTPIEDAQAILTGVVLATLGIAILSHLGFLTSGVAGLALIASYAFGINVGLAFFLINLPFYVLAATRMGFAFTFKTFLAVALLSIATAIQPDYLTFGTINPAIGAMTAGLLLGFALLALFRHRTSLGGAGILAIFLQDTLGWRAGLTQLGIDLVILGLAFFVVDGVSVLYSILGAICLNAFLAINHRTDRYLAR
ncbi:YitT family protein [Fulvimarina sp. 2208YS6-2-32]|uniref:YitT family protein n=1 Tax=Fulvimarina uroteuthidis TaxID=3098149 RepID=A0ABU5I693_9HYPH|nr:YitT family protein [Fulvimarina sp. 2208YS6-2-32]MDY8110273.1 YitT family protein [Fulvimarina sp. 2208YS6-2-32]